MRVLLTRPQPDAQATAARLEAAGHQALIAPMLRVEPIPEAVLPEGTYDALALTSVNGARLLAARREIGRLRGLPVYAVGRRTAAASPEGFADVRVAGGDGAALAELLRTDLARGVLPRNAHILHVAGQERAVELADELAGDGIAVSLFVIYRAVAATVLDPAVIAAVRERQIDAAFHFSPRTAMALATSAQEGGVSVHFQNVVHLCFSRNVAAPLEAMGWPVRIASEPTEDGLFALLDW